MASLTAPLTPLASQGKQFLKLPDVLQQERQLIKEHQLQRPPDGRPSNTPFALAFSGGGMRAAAFQCGVLWRLAKMNLLKDVELFTAVSGGGYIAMAFATHCVDEAEKNPPQPGKMKEWYERVVAKTVVRMQRNAGSFVRDFGRSGWGCPDDNSGCTPFPRILDLPVLVVTLALTMAVNPLFFFACFLVPMVLMTETFFGHDMREAFCMKGDEKAALAWFLHVDSFRMLLTCLIGVTVVTFVVYTISAIVPPMGDPMRGKEQKGLRVRQPKCFLLAHALKAFQVRLTCFLAIYTLFLYLTLYVQMFAFSAQHGSDELLNHYCRSGANFAPTCLESEAGCLPHVMTHFYYVVCFVFMGSVFLMPYLGSTYVISTACLAGPLIIVLAEMRLVQYRVFGPLTGQDFLPGNAYAEREWNHICSWCLFFAVLAMPFYNEFRSILHVYYMRCLSHNFFAEGKDIPFVRLRDNPYCPFVVVTGTSSDFRSPIAGDEDTISELSFSSLHVGSVETGFLEQPHYQTMGKCTALTAAGCIDAVALTLSSLLTMRFWLEALNLSWGDYILFSPDDTESEFGKYVNYYSGFLPQRIQGFCVRLLHRLPSTVAVWLCWVLLFVGFRSENPKLYAVAFCMFATFFMLSFFNLGIKHQEFTLSPWLRQLQQATGYHYRGSNPPPMLYITDGGCRDCVTLTQLVLRRQERILMVLAASDPHDELAVLKTGIEIVRDLGLANFYDPTDPRKDLKSMFEDYKNDKTMGYLRIGIYYEASGKEPAKAGHLFIVKNRLLEEDEGQPVMPHLTFEEMIGQCVCGDGPTPEGIKEFDPEAWTDMTTDQLGSLCCCDSSHHMGLCGNCGPKFPHGSFANFMYMTPMWCNSLARLAYDMSEECVKKAMAPELSSTWERSIQFGVRADDNRYGRTLMARMGY